MSVKDLVLKIFFLKIYFLFNINTRDEIPGQIFSFSFSGTIPVNSALVNYSFVWHSKWDGSHLLQSMLKGTVIVTLFIHSSCRVIIISAAIDLANIRSWGNEMVYNKAAGMASRAERSALVQQHLRRKTKGTIFVSQIQKRNALSTKSEEH